MTAIDIVLKLRGQKCLNVDKIFVSICFFEIETIGHLCRLDFFLRSMTF